MRAENLAQRGVEEVGSGVVAADRVAAVGINLSINDIINVKNIPRNYSNCTNALYWSNRIDYIRHN